MKHLRAWFVWIGTVGLGTASVLGLSGQTPEPPATSAPPEGVEVLTRGPIHEAFAGPVTAKPQARPTVAKHPPEPIEEVPAEQKPEGDNVQWMPGYWAWDDDRSSYLWVSGFWRVPPPDRQWMPGHWNPAPGPNGEAGWQWVPGFWAQQRQTEVAYLPPPPEIVQAAPSVPAPSPDSVFVPGTWVYRETRYVWRPGYWHAHRPGWIWVPAQFVWTPAGYVFVEGYWDYPLRERGLLFAPVVIDVAVYSQPRYYYRPAYVIQDDSLYGALFVRASHGSYYYGDYFEVGYRGQGFTAWFDFRIGGGGYDPLFSYYRGCYRDDHTWEVGLREVYVGRYNGSIARPPRTFVQQNNTTIINNNTTINKTIVNNTVNNNITSNTVNNAAVNRFINNNSVVTPLAKVDHTALKLKPVTPEAQQQDLKAAQQLRQVSAQRKQLEGQVVAKGPATSPTSVPQVVKVDLPKPPVSRNAAATKAPPPLPIKPETKGPTASAPVISPTTTKPETAVTRPEAKTKSAPATKPGTPAPAPTAPATRPEPKPAPVNTSPAPARPTTMVAPPAPPGNVSGQPAPAHGVPQPNRAGPQNAAAQTGRPNKPADPPGKSKGQPASDHGKESEHH